MSHTAAHFTDLVWECLRVSYTEVLALYLDSTCLCFFMFLRPHVCLFFLCLVIQDDFVSSTSFVCWLLSLLTLSSKHFFNQHSIVSRNRPTVQDCLEHKWLQMTDAMMKTRETNLFLSNRLRNFVLDYDVRRQSETHRMTFDDLVLPPELVMTLQPDVLTADTQVGLCVSWVGRLWTGENS